MKDKLAQIYLDLDTDDIRSQATALWKQVMTQKIQRLDSDALRHDRPFRYDVSQIAQDYDNRGLGEDAHRFWENAAIIKTDTRFDVPDTADIRCLVSSILRETGAYEQGYQLIELAVRDAVQRLECTSSSNVKYLFECFDAVMVTKVSIGEFCAEAMENFLAGKFDMDVGVCYDDRESFDVAKRAYREVLALGKITNSIPDQGHGYQRAINASCAGLGKLYRLERKPWKSRNHLVRALEGYEKETPDNPQTTKCMLSLARTLLKMGQPKEAKAIAKDGLGRCEKRSGHCSNGVSELLLDLAFCNEAQGRYAEAKVFAQRAVHIRQKIRVFGSESIVVTVKRLAYCSEKLGEYHEAGNYFQRAMTGYEKIHCGNHEDTDRCRSSMLRILRKQEKWKELNSWIFEWDSNGFD